MAPLFSFPIRMLPNGRFATVEQGTIEADEESVAMLVLTRVGERPLAPSLGVPDPTFAQVNPRDVEAAVRTFLPSVRLRSIDASPVQQHAQQVRIELEDVNAEP